MKLIPALTAVLLVAAACADEPKKPLSPTAPTISKSVTAAPASGPASTVCLSYARDRALIESELKDKPTAARLEKLQKRHSSLEELIHDACE